MTSDKYEIVKTKKSGDTRRVFEMFELINVMFPVMFIIVVGIIIFSLVHGIITWNKNNQSPRLTVPVVVWNPCAPLESPAFAC